MDLSQIDEGHEDNPEEQMVFHYNREERLKKAPQIVKDYYDGNLTAFKPGLFRALVATKANRFMLLTLVICFAVVIFLGIFDKRNEGSINGIPLSLTAFSFEENVYVSIECGEPEKKWINNGPESVIASVEFLDADKMIVEKTDVSDIYRGKKVFLRTTYHDYDIFFVKADVKISGQEKTLNCSVTKR